jgi:phosphatidylserine/phosphatidylglycerophosphate/cardiolipin synthase-like enzyme
MRFRSQRVGGYQVSAVSGTNTVSFAIDADPSVTSELLGFSVERSDPAEDERYFMYGFKVFGSVIPNPTEDLVVSTYDHPVQSFVWDDFTAKPGRRYEYFFHPVKRSPKNLDRSAEPVPITVDTEPLFTDGAHDIFFNRGVLSSQAYRRKFGNRRPDSIEPEARRRAAFDWLSRDLDDALLRFIKDAEDGDGLLCCFYEFRHRPVAEALVEAIGRGVDVRLIVDAKDNGTPARAPFPRDDNVAMLEAVAFPSERLVLRTARAASIQHNKFMVRLRGADRSPAEVWTGSTNLSAGGIYGQANVGHCVRDAAVAEQFRRYWEVLAADPGGREGDSRQTVRTKNAAFRESVERLATAPASRDDIPTGVTAVFSPRTDTAMLDLYTRLVDGADELSCITLAFGISRQFKELLRDNTPESHLAFFLLERRDVPNPRSAQPFINLNSRNNVYMAWGSYLREPLHQWARETYTKALGLNTHVAFVHSKFLLADPMGDDPIVVTGSANFSEDSSKENDENMLLIRGDRRVADIYFTEFNRLFNHYYFRSVREATRHVVPGDATAAPQTDLQTLFLAETDEWLAKYTPNSLRSKRVRVLTTATV